MHATPVSPPLKFEDMHRGFRDGGEDAAVIKKEVLGAEEELNEPEKDGDVMELSDTEEDSAPRIVAPDPGAPTDQEIEDHRIDHIPYRCWCDHCVRGRGTGEQHRGGRARPSRHLPLTTCS